MQYIDLAIRISPAGDSRYRLAATCPHGSTESFLELPSGYASFIPFATGNDRGVDLDDSDVLTAGRTPWVAPGREFGVLLYRALFQEDLRSLLDQCRGSIQARTDAGIRIRLLMNVAGRGMAEVASLPWELMSSAVTELPLVTSNQTVLVRSLDVLQPTSRVPFDPPLRILVVRSNPRESEPLNLEKELDRIRNSWAKLDDVQVEFAPPVFRSLLDVLAVKDPHVLHYMGHAKFDGRSGNGFLLLETENGEPDWVSSDRLQLLVRDEKLLRLVFLNACKTGSASDRQDVDPFAGVAAGLINAGVPAVVAMQFPITDDAAIDFADAFYDRIATGFPVDAAIAEGRKVLWGREPQEWATPVLFMRSQDGYLFQHKEPNQPGLGVSAGAGLRALVDLMADRVVHEAVLNFQTTFTIARQRIEEAADYKALHDHLHELEFTVFNVCVLEEGNAKDDRFADRIEGYTHSLDAIVRSCRTIVAREELQGIDTSWLDDLDQTGQELRVASANLDGAPLRRAIDTMRRILDRQPSKLNTQLNSAARGLQLRRLVDALARVEKRVSELHLDPKKARQFRNGVDSFRSLDGRLTFLVAEHDRWQGVDAELRRVETQVECGLDELMLAWPGIRKLVQKLRLTAESEREAAALDEAIAQNTGTAKRAFRRFRRESGTAFYQVDANLKALCEELRQIGEPLRAVLEVMV